MIAFVPVVSSFAILIVNFIAGRILWKTSHAYEVKLNKCFVFATVLYFTSFIIEVILFAAATIKTYRLQDDSQ